MSEDQVATFKDERTVARPRRDMPVEVKFASPDDLSEKLTRERLRDLKNRNYRPREAYVQVAKRCNLKCSMCSWRDWQSNSGLMEMAMFERTLGECEAAGIQRLVLANAQGEPLLNPQFFDMVELALERGFWVMVSTNGTPFTPKRIEKIANIGLDNVQFSFAGYDKETYEIVYVGARFEQVSENLRQLAAAINANDLHTTLVVNGCYTEDLRPFAGPEEFASRTRDYLTSLGVAGPRIQINLQLPHNFAGAISPTASGDAMGSASSAEEGQSWYRTGSAKPPLCDILAKSVGIYSDGRVTGCGCLDYNGELHLGDITNQSLKSIREGDDFSRLIDDFSTGNLSGIPLCANCDLPYADLHEAITLQLEQTSPVQDSVDPDDPSPSSEGLWENGSFVGAFQEAIGETLDLGYGSLGDDHTPPLLTAEQVLSDVEHYLHASGALDRAKCLRLLRDHKGGMPALFSRILGRDVRRLAIAPCSEALTPLLPQMIDAFDDVLLVDNFKAGRVIAGKTVVPLQALLDDIEAWDGVFVPTPDDDVMKYFFDAIGTEKAIGLRRIVEQHALRDPSAGEHAVYEGIRREIAAAKSPLVIFSGKVNVTMEPTLLALEKEGYDVFLITRMTRFQDQSVTEDAGCPLRRNFVVPLFGFLHLLQNLKETPAVLFYDFFLNFAWDARNAERAYAYVAALLRLAGHRVTLGCYDVIKPVCLNMEHHEAANAFYADMLDQAGGIWLNSKSDQIAEYLRNTVARDKPVISFYRYGMPPKHRLMKLSQIDGERHIVGVTSFFGETFEPNRAESGDFIRGMLRQRIHFHYYSSNRRVFEYQEALEESEKPYFHIHDHIWEQAQLAREMTKYDAGWLVGDEGPTFGRIVAQTKNRLARDLFALFVPNGVPTSSMAYGAAGLPVFASRAITILQEVFPPGCLIPLDPAETPALPAILDRIDWPAAHKTMADNSHRFDAEKNISRLAAYFDAF